ncbi:hypothetical protein Taro_015959, partial [Colocasia esculenta]|nr:hypothetical protein [Colocasia esculenta]
SHLLAGGRTPPERPRHAPSTSLPPHAPPASPLYALVCCPHAVAVSCFRSTVTVLPTANLLHPGSSKDGQASSVNIIVGSHVWVEDPTLAWIDGQVTQINGDQVEVQMDNAKKVKFHHLL